MKQKGHLQKESSEEFRKQLNEKLEQEKAKLERGFRLKQMKLGEEYKRKSSLKQKGPSQKQVSEEFRQKLNEKLEQEKARLEQNLKLKERTLEEQFKKKYNIILNHK